MNFWVLLDSGTSTIKNFEKLLCRFKTENPDIEINLKVLTRKDMWKSIFTFKRYLKPQDAPDIIEIPHYWTALLSRSEIIENLSLLDKNISVKSFLPAFQKHCYKPGTKNIYSIPWYTDVLAIHYRVDHLKAVSDNPEKDLETWDGLIKICEKLKTKFKNVPDYFPIQNADWRGSISIRSIFPCLWSKGEDIFNEKLTKSGVGNKKFKQTIADYLKLAIDGYIPVLKERGSLGNMMLGKASMVLTRRHGLDMFESSKHKFKVQTTKFSRCGSKNASYLSGISLAITNDAKNKKDALKFLKWLTKPQNQQEYAKLIEAFPTSKVAFDKLISSSPKRFHIYKEIVRTAKVLPNILVCGTAVEILNKVLAVNVRNIARQKYKEKDLFNMLDRSSQEIDYLLSLYKK